MKFLATGALKYVVLLLVFLALAAVIQMPYSYEEQVRVHATISLDGNVPQVAVFTDDNKRHSEGLIIIPPHSKLHFLSATTDQWTNDPLDIIETLLKAGPFLVDASDLKQGWKDSDGNVEKFKTWLHDQHDQILAGKYGIASTRTELPDAALLLLGLPLVLESEVIPALKNPTSLVDGQYIVVRPKGDNLYANASRTFWKRIVAVRFLRGENARVLGPYYGVEGAVGEKTSPEFKKKAPHPDSPPARLLSVIYEPELTAQALGKPVQITPFYNATSEQDVRNRSDRPQYVRLLMNDDIPEDNGPGYCDVRIVITTSISVLKMIWIWATSIG
jgi:hypothetical protein